MRLFVMLAGLLVATTAFAQDEPAEKVATEPAAIRLAALEKKVEEAFMKWREEQQEAAKKAEKAAKEGEMIPAISMMPPFGKFIPEFQAAAKEFAGKEGAVPFLLWLTNFGFSDVEVVKGATTTLVTDHIGSEQLAGFVQTLPRLGQALGDDKVASILDTVIAKSPHSAVRGWALLAKFAPLIEDPMVEIESAAYQEARTKLMDASKASKDDGLMGRVKGLIAGREQLAKGLVAPDIIGVDLDGVKFKLSDYAGKIVMLDFWGDW